MATASVPVSPRPSVTAAAAVALPPPSKLADYQCSQCPAQEVLLALLRLPFCVTHVDQLIELMM